MPRNDWKNLPRLYVTAALGARASLPLDVDQRHYLIHVMRCKQDDRILLFNGRDGEWIGTIGAVSKREVIVQCGAQTRLQSPEPDLILLFAPIKRDHLETLVQKASELGIARLQPIVTRHTIVSKVNIERLQSIAREAAEQCERLSLPEILPPLPLAQALAALDGRPLFACLENGPTQTVAEAFSAYRDAAAAFLTGPEGGLDEEEMAIIRKHAKTVAINLGPRILRADTAALAALSVWQALCGDWQS